MHGLVWFGFARGLAVVFDLVKFGSLKLSYIQNHGVLTLTCIYPIYLLNSVLYVRANMFCIKISPISFGNRQKLSCLYAYIRMYTPRNAIEYLVHCGFAI